MGGVCKSRTLLLLLLLLVVNERVVFSANNKTDLRAPRTASLR